MLHVRIIHIMSNMFYKKLVYVLCGVILLLAFLLLNPSQKQDSRQSSHKKSVSGIVSQGIQQASVPRVDFGHETKATEGNTQVNADLATKGYIVAQVVRVVDGDTISVTIDSKNTKVRLIGINTPETVDPRRGVECFGKDASNKVKEILKKGDVVYIQTDDSQQKYDSFGRLLGYVYTEKGILLNYLLVAEGYAHEYTYKYPYMFSREFKEAERNARDQKRGLWADGVCPQ